MTFKVKAPQTDVMSDDNMNKEKLVMGCEAWELLSNGSGASNGYVGLVSFFLEILC